MLKIIKWLSLLIVIAESGLSRLSPLMTRKSLSHTISTESDKSSSIYWGCTSSLGKQNSFAIFKYRLNCTLTKILSLRWKLSIMKYQRWQISISSLILDRSIRAWTAGNLLSTTSSNFSCIFWKVKGSIISYILLKTFLYILQQMY